MFSFYKTYMLNEI